MNDSPTSQKRSSASAPRPHPARKPPMGRENTEPTHRSPSSAQPKSITLGAVPTKGSSSRVSPSASERNERRSAPSDSARRETPRSASTSQSNTSARRTPPQGALAKSSPPSRNDRRHPAQSRKKDTVSRADAARKKKRPVSRKNDGDEDYGGSTLIPSLVKAVVYIMSILVVSGVISYFAITVGNDVFAFVKEGDPIQLTVTPGTDSASLGELLHDHGIIKYPKIFDFYIGLRYGNKLEFEPGDYTVSPTLGYDALVYTFVKSNRQELVTVVVSIPEGYTVKQIIRTLVDKYGLSSEEELTDAIQNADFDYWFIDELEKSGIGNDRKYRLEGYLYPDTYYYYSNASAEAIINKMLKNFDTKLKNTFKNSAAPGDTYQEKILNLCKEREMSFDEIVTLASMIQMEAKYDYEYPKVSAVFNNRLRNPAATNGMLESCATVLYVLGIRVPILSDEQTKTDDPYNTYINKGLPPGAISNPTYLAINYALYPDMECGYYFFVAAPDGTSLFAKTQKQHEENIKLVKEMMEDS